jgi:uncharacterized protein GlcG (DUF336 family)
MRLRLAGVSALGLLALATLGSTCNDGNGTSVGCDGSCPRQHLSASDVRQILGRAIAEARANDVRATIGVTDRVGNVLAVYRMNGAAPNAVITSQRQPPVQSGLESPGINQNGRPSELVVISKAGTGAYLSSQGNAFTTRTASQIVQENFNPGEQKRAGGPLFGVQFSQLPCSNFSQDFINDQLRGPKRLPLGLSADPGGLPLYKDGDLVGGVGIEVDGSYTLDPVIRDDDDAVEERIASAAASDFSAPTERRADRITVDGRALRFADDEDMRSDDGDLGVVDVANLVDVPGFYSSAGGILAGTEFETDASGVSRSNAFDFDAEILVDAGGNNRFPPSNSATPTLGAGGLSAAEVRSILNEALGVADQARAQIRRPTGDRVRVSIAVTDLSGNVLGFARSPDAPVFGMDVSVQKARAAGFFSRGNGDPPSSASSALSGSDAVIDAVPGLREALRDLGVKRYSLYLSDVRQFIGDNNALSDGTAFGNRPIGLLARPFFPDGINGDENGPFSRAFDDWSPFSTGLQLDLALPGIALALCAIDADIRQALADSGFIASNNPASCTFSAVNPPESCADTSANIGQQGPLADHTLLGAIGNGIQIFPGSVPIYRNGALIGAVGISGDGVDQDDMVGFLGLHRAGEKLDTGIGNAPRTRRADEIVVDDIHLRYVNCPPSPFNNSDTQNVCSGK